MNKRKSHEMTGKKVKFSDKGKQTFPRRSSEREGIIINESRDQRCWIIKWDDFKSPVTIHKDYIQTNQP